MKERSATNRSRLPRLPAEWYRGHAWVHWSMTLDRRATGWLDALHHARLRELLVHALGRHGVVCPVYCVMPDHAHFLWAGTGGGSDQREAARALRTAWNAELRKGGRSLQRQGYDHVLREKERTRGAVMSAATYILENPVRAGLAGSWEDYPFSGAMVPGYPSLDPRKEDFWEVFWRVYAACGAEDDRGGAGGERLTPSATARGENPSLSAPEGA